MLALAAPAQLVIGDWAARTVAEDQPTKLAAMEGLDETTEGADLTVGGVYFDGEVHGGVAIPDLLSLLAFHDPDATVEGLDAVPADDRPPVGWVRNAFQVMVGIGTLLALLAVWFLWSRWRRGALPRFALVLPRGGGRRPALARRPDRGLDRHRGRAGSPGSSMS